MEIFVYSRLAIERIAPFDVPHIFISITTTREERARLPENEHTLGVLRLAFLDRTTPPGDIFTETMADEIVRFVTDHHTRGAGLAAIVVHCDAGVSRSPGVAAALARGFFREDDAGFFRRYVPNRLVYRSILLACARPEAAIDACIERIHDEANTTLGRPFTDAEIATLEELAGRPLPRSYRHFLRRWGSLKWQSIELLPFERIAQETEMIQSLDEGASRVHRAVIFEMGIGHAFDFRVETDFDEPSIVRYSAELGVDAFPHEATTAFPEKGTEHFASWLARVTSS